MADGVEVVVREKVEEVNTVTVESNKADEVSTGQSNGDAIAANLDESTVEEPNNIQDVPEKNEADAEFSDVDDFSDVGSSEFDANSEDLDDEDSLIGGEEEDIDEEFVDAGEDVERVADQEPWVTERRHSGDGEEQPDKAADLKKLDDDEDRQNPAYVPRKGAFFEHDLRLGDEADDEKQETESKMAPKKLWQENSKWKHDRFDERSQAPKSHDEIIATYGFDIRTMNDGSSSGTGRSRTGKKLRGSRRSEDPRLGDFMSSSISNSSNSTSVSSYVDTSQPSVTVTVENRLPAPALAPVETVPEVSHAAEPKAVVHQISNETSEPSREAVERRSYSSGRGRGVISNTYRRDGVTTTLTVGNIDRTRRTTGRVAHGGGFHDENSRNRAEKQWQAGGNIEEAGPRHSMPHKDDGRQMVPQPAQMPRLARTIRTGDRRPGPPCTSRVISTSEHGTAGTNSGVAVTIVTESQDARRCYPDVVRTSAVSERDRDRRSEKKSTLIVHSSMAPEMIPPVTRVVTYSKSNKAIRSKGGPSQSASTVPEVSPSQRVTSEPGRGWTGGEFTPASRNLPSSSEISGAAGGRTKRYSSQRQRTLPEQGSAGDLPPTDLMSPPPTTSLVATTQIVSTMLHSSARPLPATAFFANPRTLSPAQLQLLAGSLAVAGTGPRPLLHGPYMAGPTGPVQMLPHGPFMPPAVLGYGPPLTNPTGPPNFVPVQFAGVPIPPEVATGNSLEVRGGTVYFSAEVHQPGGPERGHGRTIYFDPGQQMVTTANARSPGRRPNAAIPIVNPQELASKSAESSSSEVKTEELTVASPAPVDSGSSVAVETTASAAADVSTSTASDEPPSVANGIQENSENSSNVTSERVASVEE